MSQLKKFFKFLGGIHLAIALIAVTALAVIIGTILESQTGSHLVAAKWTYENPFFLLLLSLFFINILFSALRRWPFQKKHIPFLITHLGLLMVIGGTILKNRLGLQGQLSVWEGSGNQHVMLPHTYAISIDEKGHSSDSNKNSFIDLDSFQPNIYYPFHFPHLKCKIIGYAPHVKENLETWIKGTQAYIAGFPPIPVQDWEPSLPFPEGKDYRFARLTTSNVWNILSLRTLHVQQALQKSYIQGLVLQLKAKNGSSDILTIPLSKAIEEPFSFAQGNVSAVLNLTYPLSDKDESPSLVLCWQSHEGKWEERLTIPLQGQDSLLPKCDPPHWSEASFTVDLIRPHPHLFLVDDQQGNTIFFAFDPHGRLHEESFSASHLQTFISYDQGFNGYGVQAVMLLPSFPVSREDKEKGHAHELISQLKHALAQQPPLAPPLRFFERACQKAQVDFAETFVEFLTHWHASPGFLFHPHHPFSPRLELTLRNLDWQEMTHNDQQTVQWTSHLLDQLETSLKEGHHPLTILERYHWPFLSELQQSNEQSQNSAPLNLLAQQISSLTPHLPLLNFPASLSTHEHAHLLSAYFRSFGIDYRSLCPFRGGDQEEFDYLEAYWQARSSSEKKEMQKTIIFETPLTNRVIPDPAPPKLEDRRPGIVIEIQKGLVKQSFALAYDSSGVGLKWPVLNGSYLIRFQPQLRELPYRIRLRQAREISYPQSSQIYSYESDILLSSLGNVPITQTISMNHVYETWDGYRFYLAGVGTSSESGLKRIQLIVNHDPAKYFLTYPGALLVFMGIVLLFWIFPYRKKSS
jgi:hypothetical protein